MAPLLRGRSRVLKSMLLDDPINDYLLNYIQYLNVKRRVCVLCYGDSPLQHGVTQFRKEPPRRGALNVCQKRSGCRMIEGLD